MHQFLFSTKKIKKKQKKLKKINVYNLYYDKELNLNYFRSKNSELYLLGDLYDWENPELTNEQILKNLVVEDLKIQDLLWKINKYSGEFVLIFINEGKIFLVNDACSQREIYYTDDFCSFASQIKLLEKVSNTNEVLEKEIKAYYTSDIFIKNKLHIGDKTHKKHIKHLLPNHYIDVFKKNVSRFFPLKTKTVLPLDIVSKKAAKMLKGYLKAISLRKKIVLGVTAGYDSRVLFLASLDVNCKYYVNKTLEMNDNHYDIVYSKKLTSIYNKDLRIINKDSNKIDFLTEIQKEKYVSNIDFPSFFDPGITTRDDEIIINGNISEIARNYYGYHKSATSKDLCFLAGNSNQKYVIRQYNKWLKNKIYFTNLGYNYLDMFYWEEKMGNWQAKVKTESYALNKNITTPYNSRALLTLLLSTRRKYRDSHFNKLYDKIISELSKNNNKVKKLPINYSRRTTIIRWLKYVNLYNFYRYLGVKTRKLKI